MKKQLGRTPEKEIKLIRNGNGGARVYINGEVLTKALELAGIDPTSETLYGTATAVNDGRRAKVMVHIYTTPIQNHDTRKHQA